MRPRELEELGKCRPRLPWPSAQRAHGLASQSPSLCMVPRFVKHPAPGPSAREDVRKPPRVRPPVAGPFVLPLGSGSSPWASSLLARLTLFCFEFLGLSLVDMCAPSVV